MHIELLSNWDMLTIGKGKTLNLKNHKSYASFPPFTTMGKRLHPNYCHCRNT